MLCVLAALALVPGVSAVSAQPRPSGGAISSEEPTKATDTTAPEGEDTRRHPTGKKEEGQRPTMLYVKNHHPAGILTDVHVHMPRKKLMRSVVMEAREAMATAAVMVRLEGRHSQGRAPPVRSSSCGPTGMAPPTGHPPAS